MNSLINNIPSIDEDIKENLFVNKIIVNEEKRKFESLPYISTEKWIKQLGNRLESNC